jgi:hypothetical protein
MAQNTNLNRKERRVRKVFNNFVTCPAELRGVYERCQGGDLSVPRGKSATPTEFSDNLPAAVLCGVDATWSTDLPF